MDQNIKIIDSYKRHYSRYTLSKKKKQLYVKDGIITYKIDPTNYSCQCSQKLCFHSIFAIQQIFSIDVSILKFFHKLRSSLQTNNNSSDIMNLISNNILNDECGICTLPMKYSDDLHECSFCEKYCHKSCINRWINNIKNTKHNKNCIYCNSVKYL